MSRTDRGSRMFRPARQDRNWLVVGNFGNRNTGDEAILAGFLMEVPADSVVTVVSRNPELVSKMHGVHAVRTLSWSSIAAFVRADVLVVAGGGMFGAGLPRLVALLPFVTIAAACIGIDLQFASIGAYEDMPRLVRFALQLACCLASKVSVRDEMSREVISSNSTKLSKIDLKPDLSIRVPPASLPELQHLLPDIGDSQFVVVSLKAIPNRTVREHVMTELGAALADLDPDVVIVFLCLSAQGDYNLGPSISDHVLSKWMNDTYLDGRGVIVGPDLTPTAAKGIVAHGRAVIGMRLHAQVFADSCGIPVLGIVFEAKTRGWMRKATGKQIEAAEVSAPEISAWLTDELRRVSPSSAW